MKTFFISLIPVYNCFILIFISCLLKSSDGVPDDFCLVPLNKSDCGKPVTPVFTYWLPGSRCEIEFWRGCPTTNKFPNEFVCSHYCIGNLVDSGSNELLPLRPTYPEDNPCDEVFNGDDCQKEPAEVYTYNKTIGLCVKLTWRGCESRNRFEDEVDCIKVCQAKAFEEDVNKLNEQEVKDINNILDEAVTEPEEPETTTETTTEEEETTTEHHEDEETTAAEPKDEGDGDVEESITT